MEIKFNRLTGEIIKFRKLGYGWIMDDSDYPYGVHCVDERVIPDKLINTKEAELCYVYIDGMFIRRDEKDIKKRRAKE